MLDKLVERDGFYSLSSLPFYLDADAQLLRWTKQDG